MSAFKTFIVAAALCLGSIAEGQPTVTHTPAWSVSHP